MADIKELSYLLAQSKAIINHQQELQKARGEHFNIFSILSLERNENKTHSAFLAELLNPQGAHLQGSIFLQRFLEVLQEKSLDWNTAQVKVEHYIGPRNDKVKTGGRIHIYIWDKTGRSLVIENKIDAEDQDVQIERYCNFRKGNCKGYYLTLKGEEPDRTSKGKLQNGIDYYTISYREEVQEWLDSCIKEAAEQPILRESIKQYKLLIQKLTATMDKTHQDRLKAAMFSHFRESAYIAANFDKMSAEFKEELREKVLARLEEQLKEDYLIRAGETADKKYSQIWIKIKGIDGARIHFGLEPFSGQGHGKGDLFIGVVNFTGSENPYTEAAERFNKNWVNVAYLTPYQQYEMNLSNPKTLQRLYADKAFYDEFITHIVEEVENYLAKHVEGLREYLEKANQH